MTKGRMERHLRRRDDDSVRHTDLMMSIHSHFDHCECPLERTAYLERKGTKELCVDVPVILLSSHISLSRQCSEGDITGLDDRENEYTLLYNLIILIHQLERLVSQCHLRSSIELIVLIYLTHIAEYLTSPLYKCVSHPAFSDFL